MGNPRKTALSILMKIDNDNAYSNITLNNAIKASDLDERDVSFACAIVYGVLERKITLDYIISKFIKTKLNKIQPDVLNILRMGVFQIAYMDKVPDSAAVNECVKLAKKRNLFSATGFINGVLRSVSRAEGNYQLPDKKADKLSYYSVYYSCPQDIISLWLNSYGEEITENILQNLSGRPPVYVRVNTLKVTAENLEKDFETCGVSASPTDIIEDALVIKDTGSIESLALYSFGYFHVQDLSSQLCCKVLNPVSGDKVYDFCSAPGGKAFTIAQRMDNNGVINAFDLYDHKLKLIEAGAERLGIDIIKVGLRDAVCTEPLEKADKVLCDVPCSGLGIIRRKPEIRYKKDTGIDTLPQLQYDILSSCSDFVKVGGTLVYSTCTLNKKENNNNADKFLQEHPNFAPVPIDLGDMVKRVIDEPANQLTLFPNPQGSDGFFISVFKKIK
ncbi:MAG TPA: 16S rRNA (cytosine(967)-C(5))-methyltransferase RsmB [Clostridiales bacterium]|nr:16S rRNA (cytosine(967)-C(5))-methyltransferase RsmB [Clostridiales bacterium]